MRYYPNLAAMLAITLFVVTTLIGKACARSAIPAGSLDDRYALC